VLGESGGGLEHLASTLMITSRFNTEEDDPFEKWLGLVAHEHFHAWNVKRLRPAALGPFDYESEVYTESLWIAEGFTSYYDDLLLARAGLIDADEYLSRMNRNLERLESTPGRLEQPVSRASYDAWIKYYRGDENSVNTAISYYTKGAVLGWVIDARIRRLTNNERTLDDAMRLAFQRYSGEAGYAPEDFVAVLSEVAGTDMGPLVHQLAETTDEIDLTEALEVFGLTRTAEASDDPPTGWLGVTTRGGQHVDTVLRGSPAWKAGLNVDDEILAVNGDRVSDLPRTLKPYREGDTVEILVSRRGRLRTLEVKLSSRAETGTLAIDKRAKRKAAKTRESWLGLEK
jgi:predicted metalloprotease with PDZ domain